MVEEGLSNGATPDQEEVKKYVVRLNDQSDDELGKIITRYISYKPDLVEAALYISVNRGIISYDLKEQLSHQIFRNFAAHARGIKQTRWENNNAFSGFVSRYTDDEIYKIIEDPSNIVIDVYHAVLMAARDRGLITEDNFRDYYSGGMSAGRSDEEIHRDEWINYVKDVDTSEVELTESEIEKEKEKYWKCPFCNQLVDINLTQCWNCQAEKPENPVHPEKEEVLKEYAFNNTPSLTKSGLGVLGGGIILTVAGFLHKYVHSYSHHHDYISIGLGIIAIILGVALTIAGMSRKSGEQ